MHERAENLDLGARPAGAQNFHGAFRLLEDGDGSVTLDRGLVAEEA
ncbi:hypothetical protein JK386_04940 [Nocardioides sp. zg-536]|uniref:Uncharacterized protein n=1 Tax=Nocardioides faecalis TaxID=2803858 RepID=A0A938Y4T6_9ACTN|nr:hypothetical protein [Nocardioides faecalis]MBM9459239.1 hypothetical protein [Nocardioides faecalis]QVI59626.1 hypothetical protein KG111_04575 [Nocardioides faecalis]